MRVTIVNAIAATPDVTPSALLRPAVPSVAEPLDRLRHVNIVELGEALARKGHKVTVILGGPYLRGEPITLTDSLRVIPTPTALPVPFHPGLLPLTPSLEADPAISEADVIQANEFHQPATFFAARGGQQFHVPLVLWQETYRPMRFPGSLYQGAFERTLGRQIRRAVRRFIPRTSRARDYLRALGIPEDTIHSWIPTGIDVGDFSPGTTAAHAEDYGWPADSQVLLVIGRLHAGKGVDLAIRALAWLRGKAPRARLLVAGAGPEMESLVTLARNLHVAEEVRFLSQVPRATAIQLYNLAEVVLSPSRSDLLPFTLMEAGACACPVVATDVGAVTDIIVDGVTGAVVPAEDVEGLARRTLELLQDEPMREEFGRASRLRAETVFDVNRVAGQMTEAYHEAAG